jgi:serine protease Do
LRNFSGTTKVVVKEVPKREEFEGVVFEDIKNIVKERLDIEGGAAITGIENKEWTEAGLKPGFIITKIGRIRINTAADVTEALKNYKGEEVSILGVYPNGQRSYYDIKP